MQVMLVLHDLHQHFDEHEGSSSSTDKHLREKHLLAPKDLRKNFIALKKCTKKFDCLVYEISDFYQLTETKSQCTV